MPHFNLLDAIIKILKHFSSNLAILPEQQELINGLTYTYGINCQLKVKSMNKLLIIFLQMHKQYYDSV